MNAAWAAISDARAWSADATTACAVAGDAIATLGCCADMHPASISGTSATSAACVTISLRGMVISHGPTQAAVDFVRVNGP